MDSVQFERLISARNPNMCLRDMAFDYFCAVNKDTQIANQKTKEFFDRLHEQFVK